MVSGPARDERVMRDAYVIAQSGCGLGIRRRHKAALMCIALMLHLFNSNRAHALGDDPSSVVKVACRA